MNKLCFVLTMAAYCWPAAVAAQDAMDVDRARSPLQARSPLIVFLDPEPSDRAAQVLRDALAALARGHGGALLDLSPKPAPPADAAKLWAQGEEAYRAFEYDGALEHLDAAVAEVARTGGAGLSAGELSDLHILRSLVFSQRGDERRAWEELVAAATLDPTRQLDPVRFPPGVIETFGRATAAIQASPHSQFSVDVESTCQVWIDSRDVAAGEVRSLPLGQHYVRVHCPGALPYGARLLVQEQQERWRPALRRPEVPSDARLVEMARQRAAGSLIVARVHVSPDAPSSVSIRWLALESGSERQRVTGALTDADAARTMVQATADMLGSDAMHRAASEPRERPRSRTRNWYHRPWVWAVIGAATTALVLSPLLLDSPSPRGFEVRPIGELPGAW